MVTVLMAILIFMGIGWQFAFEQWGTCYGTTETWAATLPISSSKSCVALAGDVGAGAFPIGANADSNTIYFYQQKINNTKIYYLVISKV